MSTKYDILKEFVERLREDAITDDDRVFAAKVSDAATRFLVPKLQEEIRQLEHSMQVESVRQEVDRYTGIEWRGYYHS